MHHASRAFLSVLTAFLALVSIAAGTDRFVSMNAPVLGLTHVRVIDGTGRSANEDQTLVIDRGRIVAIGRTGTVDVPASAQVLDLTGRTVIPGLVGMHEHLFYELQPPGSRSTVVAAQEVFTKLYLAAGVTTIRTAGTTDLQGDLRIKRLVDAGSEPGPTIHITGPYLNAIGTTPNPDAIARRVNVAADLGATSFKAYTTLRSAELKAAIDTAHARGLRVTGHLCAVGYGEAAALGIDNLEHGLIFDTEFYSRKQPDECPSQRAVFGELLNMRITDVKIQRTIATLIRHGVTVTSTLAVIESFTGRDGVLDENLLTMLSPRRQQTYRAAREAWSNPNADWPRAWQRLLSMEMQFERAFVAAGGKLMAGVDPTGWGGVAAGSGDHREVELLVEAGLSPEAAIKVATANGATFLGDSDIGTIETGKRADLVVVRGNPAKQIADLRNVEMVLKDGIGYNPTALIAATRGTLGEYDVSQILRWPWNALLTGLLLLLTGRIVWRRSGKMIMQAVSS